MSLADWQISLISASVGTAIPLVLVLLREVHVESKRRKQIRDALCAELTLSRQALDQALKQGKDTTAGFLVSDKLPNYENFPLATTFYDDITIDALATTVNLEALKNLALTYNLINRFNSGRILALDGFWTDETTMSGLISQIDKAIEYIKKDC